MLDTSRANNFDRRRRNALRPIIQLKKFTRKFIALGVPAPSHHKPVHTVSRVALVKRQTAKGGCAHLADVDVLALDDYLAKQRRNGL